jgi:hypothetical protein
MKRLTLALAAIGLTAASFTASAEINVTVPQLQGGLVAGITGLYLEPSSSNGDLDYVAINNNSTAANPLVQVIAINPGFDFGWGANLGYVFPNTGNDVNLSYWHLNTSDSSTTNTSVDGALNSKSFPVGGTFSNLPFTTSFSNAKFRLNQVDLTAGQYINIDSHLELHPFAGLRYADVKRTSNSNYSGVTPSFTFAALISSSTIPVTDSAAITNASVTEESDFDGVGPLAGMDLNVPIVGGLGIQAEFSGALLFGNIDSKLQSVVNIGASQQIVGLSPNLTFNLLPAIAQFSFTSNTRRVIPNLNTSLGAYYRFAFQNQSDATLGVNYQVAEYWEAVDRLKSSARVNYPSGSFLGPNTANFPAVFLTGPVTSQSANLFVQGVAVSLTYHASPTV